MPISDEQQALAEGELLFAELFGLGGDQWTVAGGGGDGVTGPAGARQLGIWIGRVKRSKATQLVALTEGNSPLPGARIGVDEWHAIGAHDEIRHANQGPLMGRLHVGCTLTSIETPSLRFTVKAPIAVAGYVRFILEAL